MSADYGHFTFIPRLGQDLVAAILVGFESLRYIIASCAVLTYIESGLLHLTGRTRVCLFTTAALALLTFNNDTTKLRIECIDRPLKRFL